MGNTNQSTRRDSKLSCSDRDDTTKTNLRSDPMLSSVEVRLIKKHWAQARKQGVEEPGLQILLEIFRRQPEIEQLFVDIDEEKKKSVTENVQFPFQLHGIDEHDVPPQLSTRGMSKMTINKTRSTAHAQRFCRILDIIVEKLDSLETICPMLKILGYRHSKLAVSSTHSFNPSFWDTFGEVLVEKSVSWSTHSRAHRNSMTVTSWCRLVLFVISYMKKGYEEAKRMNNYERRIHNQCMSELVNRKNPPIYVSNALNGREETEDTDDFEIENCDPDRHSIV